MFAEVLKHSLMITGFVFAMMVAVDYLNVLSRGRLESYIRGGPLRQYIGSSLLGATPGCLGAFASSSLYIHGFISFGAIVAAMIATSGDEAFVMLALFPGRALFLFGILFGVGIAAGWTADRAAAALKLKPCQACDRLIIHRGEEVKLLTISTFRANFKKLTLQRAALLLLSAALLYAVFSGLIGPPSWNWIRVTLALVLLLLTFIILTVPDHFLEEHIWEHTARKHLWRVFLWTFGALFLVGWASQNWDLPGLISRHQPWVLLIAALLGLIPESGPHLVFVMMYSQGLIPFSILLTSSIVQDGHGMLPLLSTSIRDFSLIKVTNLIFGLLIGYLCFLAGW